MTGRTRVLVATDDAWLRSMLADALELDGYDVQPAVAGACLSSVGRDQQPWLVLLDVDTVSAEQQRRVVQAVRQREDQALVLLGGDGALPRLVAGLDAGADDYLRKPFPVGDLLARLRAVRRRGGGLPATVWRSGDLILDESDHRVTRGDQPVELTMTEFRLLRALLRHQDRMLSKRDLLARAWDYAATEPALVEYHMSRLHRRLNALGPDVIETVRGAGYRVARLSSSDTVTGRAQREWGISPWRDSAAPQSNP